MVDARTLALLFGKSHIFGLALDAACSVPSVMGYPGALPAGSSRFPLGATLWNLRYPGGAGAPRPRCTSRGGALQTLCPNLRLTSPSSSRSLLSHRHSKLPSLVSFSRPNRGEETRKEKRRGEEEEVSQGFGSSAPGCKGFEERDSARRRGSDVFQP